MSGLNFLQFHKMYSTSFQPPYPRLDAIESPLTVLAEQVQAVHTHIARTGILSPKGDKVTSLAPVNDIVQHCHIPCIETALETKFTRVSGDGDGDGPSPGLSDDVLDSLLLDTSKLQFLGVRTAFFKPQGHDGYTITGCENRPLNTVKRHIRQIWIWDEAMIHRINSTLWSVLSEAFDMTMVPDLVSPMYGIVRFSSISSFSCIVL